MKALTYFAVAAQIAATHQVSVVKLEVTLNGSAAAGLFFQIHDSIVAAAEGAVPLKVWPAAECGYKEFELGQLNVGLGLYVCLSTTSATKTLAAGGSDLCDILAIELSDPEIPTGTTFAGDLTSAVTGLQVWTEADGVTRKTLIRLEVDGTNLTTATQFIQLFATDTVNVGDKPVMMWPIGVGAVKIGANALWFGNSGREVFSKDTVDRVGCTVKISSTAGTYTAATGTARIKAEYKNAL